MSTIQLTMLAETQSINRGIKEVNGQLAGFGKGVSKVSNLMKVAFAGVAAKAVFDFGKATVDAASDAQQSLGATETVFGKSADSIIAKSNKAAKAVGLSANVYRENANLIGSLFSNKGLKGNELAKQTDLVIKKGADLSATFGGSASDAVEALSSAFKGEFDPLERYGISVKQSTINTEAAALAQKKYGKDLKNLSDAQQNAIQRQATMNLINKQSAKSVGAFAKENDTLAHQQQVLGAQWDNLKAKLGTALLPIVTKVFTALNNGFTPAVQAVAKYAGIASDVIKGLFSGGGKSASAFAPVVNFIKGQVLPAIQGIANAYMNLFNTVAPIVGQIVNVVISKWSEIAPALQSIWTSVQTIITSALSIIQTYVRAGTAVVRAIWSVFGSDIVRFISGALSGVIKIVSGAFKIVAGIFKTVSSLLRGDWKGAWNGIKQIVSGALSVIRGIIGVAMAAVRGVIGVAWSAIKALTSAAWSGIKSAVSHGISGMVSLVRSIPGKVTSAIGNLGSLLFNAGASILQGLIDGIQSKISSLTSKLSSITKLIPKHKGPESVDKRLLRKSGQWIMQGLVKGFDDGVKGVQDALEDITKRIAKHFEKAFPKNKAIAAKATREVLKSVKDEAKALLKAAKAHEKAATAVATAKKTLDDLKKTAADYATGIAKNITDTGNITSLDSPFTAGAMVQALQDRLAKAQAFASVIKQLVAKGLNKSAIDQFVQAGVSSLGYAQALLAGGSGAIAQVNDIQAQLASVGNTVGQTASDALYKANIKAAQTYVTTLERNEKRLLAIETRKARAYATAVSEATPKVEHRHVIEIKANKNISKEEARNIARAIMTLPVTERRFA